MKGYPEPLKELIRYLTLLPGVGEKSALRMALKILKLDDGTVEKMGEAIVHARKNIRYCERCGFFAGDGLCEFCSDPSREDIICVVEEPQDVFPIERSGEYKGRYHVLGGAISPVDGILPEDLSIDALVRRVSEEKVDEVIMATSLTVEGEATAAYLSGVLKEKGIRVTRIAYGMPIGADLEYADEFTVGKAISYRREM
ncbi:MAG: recombination protein RecR [Deltaproteobacteria bacterium]|nr:MAG: recombination protein RecR [Deltaproteobacteria bacterium]